MRSLRFPTWLGGGCLAAALALTVPAAGLDDNQQMQKLLKEAALILLKEGNARFAADKAQHPNSDASQRTLTATEGQTPLVTVLSCADSRAPVELIFDRGVGELFTIRVAGNVADTDEIATIEYGVGHLGTPLLVVLGHTKCGAVTAVVKDAELHGHLPELVDNIKPAAARAKAGGGGEAAIIVSAIKENVWQSVSDILRRSSIVREKARQGRVRVLGAIYDLETGKVEWLGEHPQHAALLASTGTGTPHAAPGHGQTPPPSSLLNQVSFTPPTGNQPHAEPKPPASKGH